MKVTLSPAGDDACNLHETTCSTSVAFPIPLSKDEVVALMRAILLDPESRELGSGMVHVDRVRDGLRLHVGSGSFTVKYAHALPLVLEA